MLGAVQPALLMHGSVWGAVHVHACWQQPMGGAWYLLGMRNGIM